jgi:hypothetical protein
MPQVVFEVVVVMERAAQVRPWRTSIRAVFCTASASGLGVALKPGHGVVQMLVAMRAPACGQLSSG